MSDAKYGYGTKAELLAYIIVQLARAQIRDIRIERARHVIDTYGGNLEAVEPGEMEITIRLLPVDVKEVT